MYRFLKIFNMIRSKAYKSFIRRNAKKIRQILCSKENRQFYRSFRKHDHARTVEIGNKLIKNEGNNPEFLRAYGLSLGRLGYLEEGERMLHRALNAIAHCDYNQVLTFSQKAFSPNSISKVEHMLLGGYTNFGFLKHHLIDGQTDQNIWLTKITRFESISTKYERHFYLEVGKLHPRLIELAPKLAAYQMIPRTKVELLTTEYIDSEQVATQDLKKVMKINKIIESIPYQECKTLFKDVEMKVGRYIPSHLHQKAINLEALLEMRIHAEKTDEKHDLNELVSRIHTIVIGNRLYNKIKPEIHYAFCHYDFHWKNILVQKQTGKHFVIDWNNFGIAMRGWDMNYYFGNFRYDFHEIEDIYVSQIKFDDPVDERIAKIYFAFLQVYVWFFRMDRYGSPGQLTSHFAPAVEFMEKTSEELAEFEKHHQKN